MKEFHIYKDIRQRTNGEIYLGVVGPVRTGKSTFIRRFMEEMVIPHMEDGPAKTRSKDELERRSGSDRLRRNFLRRAAESAFPLSPAS